jgi:hypothetical protein
MISSAAVDEVSNTLILEWLDEGNKLMAGRLRLPKGNAATHLCLSLDELLKSLTLEAEHEERKTRYQSFLWKTAYHVWVLVGLLSQTVQQLAHEDWDAVDASLNQATETVKELTLNGAADISTPIQALVETAPYRDAPSILRKVMAALKTLGTLLNDELALAEDWGELALENSPGLKWRDIRYIFLFAARYKLLPLWQQMGEIDKVEDSLLRLTKFSYILAEEISDELQPGDSFEKGPASRIASIMDAAARTLETSLKVNAGIA